VIPPKPENPFTVKRPRQKPLRVMDVPDMELPILPALPEATAPAQVADTQNARTAIH
jgi:hypothetical protein